MRGLTVIVIIHRRLILVSWLVLFVVGSLGAAKLVPARTGPKSDAAHAGAGSPLVMGSQ